MRFAAIGVLLSLASLPAQVSKKEMEAIYREVRTPFKYGIVLQPPEGKKVDCPNVFRYRGKWYMLYVQLENDPEGYITRLAESDDLLTWRPLRTLLERGAPGTWDAAQAAGGLALFDTRWGGAELRTHDGKYWISYLGGPNPGYETPPLSIGLASAADPVSGKWEKAPQPALRVDDPDARPAERTRLYKSFVFRDEKRTLGAPFVMFYNAHTARDSERIFAAVSDDMKTWRRHGSTHVLGNESPDGKRAVISGDPQIARVNGLWVMFYFGAFWKPGAFDTFAVSRDLMNWTKWEGPDLIAPSEPWDNQYAHKPWLLKHRGVVYHFYCSVDKAGNRSIALATSVDLRKRR